MRRVLLLVTSFAAFGQSLPTFEVASVKPQPWGGNGSSVGVFVRGNTLDAEHCSLNDLVSFAYELRDIQLSGGPAWGDRSHMTLNEATLYQVIAKTAGDTPPPAAVFRKMLQALLAERFQLKVHQAAKEFPIYNLTIDKGGPKMKASPADAKFTNMQSSIGRYGIRMVTTQLTMQKFVDMIAGYTGRPVFDKTGLAGGYEFTLEFIPEAASDRPDLPPGVPSIFTAFRNTLGLRLEPAMASFDTVVIDHAEKPAAN